MDAPQLRQLVEKLQSEIRKTRTADEKDQEMLVRLDAEIHEFLNRTAGNKTELNPATIQRLEDAMHRFEATHPALTNLITQLLEDLSNAGI